MCKIIILKKSKETYWCNKHKCFHKYMYKGKSSQTYKECLNSNNFYKFKFEMTTSEITHLTIGKSLKNYSIKSHKKTIGSRKQ